jgi:hypothetical protein
VSTSTPSTVRSRHPRPCQLLGGGPWRPR